MDLVSFDPDIIPDEKERKFKEAFELFRRAYCLHEGIFALSLIVPESPKVKLFYEAAILHLTKERDNVIEEAISRYNQSKSM